MRTITNSALLYCHFGCRHSVTTLLVYEVIIKKKRRDKHNLKYYGFWGHFQELQTNLFVDRLDFVPLQTKGRDKHNSIYFDHFQELQTNLFVDKLDFVPV